MRPRDAFSWLQERVHYSPAVSGRVRIALRLQMFISEL